MARRSIFSGWQILFAPAMFVPFVLGAVALAVLGIAIFEILRNLLGHHNYALLGIGISALLIIGVAGGLFNRFLYRWRPSSPLIGKKKPEKYKGLILLVSNEATCRKAIEYHSDILSYCWLICSNTSLAKAESLQREFTDESTTFKLELISDEDVFDPIIFKEKVEKIYGNLPEYFSENDVILDFTGMTGIASVGSVLACLNGNRAIQYVPAVYDASLNALKPREPIEVELNWAVPSFKEKS